LNILNYIILFFFLLFPFKYIFPQTGWIEQYSGINTTINCIYFENHEKGIAIGDSGKIIITSDGGNNWISVSSGTSKSLRSMSFSSINAGYIVGDSGVNIKSTDGGFSWSPSNITNLDYNFATVFFLNENLGFAGGNNLQFTYNYIYKTTNGGISWDSLPEPYKGGYVKKILFVNPDIGWAVKFQPPLGTEILFKTSDGGNNWEFQFNNSQINSFYFIDSLKGWVLATLGSSYIFRTINGGQNWLSRHFCGINVGYSLFFINENKGWIGGGSNIHYTVNGGANWTNQNTNHEVNYNGIYFTDSLTGWAAGDSGVILKTTTGGVLTGFSNSSSEIPDQCYLSQNYPNPFNPVSKINFGLPRHGQVSLKVYNVLGNEVVTLVNESRPAGSYEVNFDGSNFPSGIYFYDLVVDGKIIDTKRMLLLK